MEHRHLNHHRFTLAAIDDVISRGNLRDWCSLRLAVLSDLSIAEKIERVCTVRVVDPYAQRYYFWLNYAKLQIEKNSKNNDLQEKIST